MCSSSHRMPPHLHKASENTSQRSQKSLAVQRVNVLKVFSYFYLKSYPNKSAEFHCFSRCEFIYLFIYFGKSKSHKMESYEVFPFTRSTLELCHFVVVKSNCTRHQKGAPSRLTSLPPQLVQSQLAEGTA